MATNGCEHYQTVTSHLYINTEEPYAYVATERLRKDYSLALRVALKPKK